MAEHFLITGGTGFLGMHLLSGILRTHAGCTVTLLIRAASDAEAAARLEAVLETIRTLYGCTAGPGQVHALPGDVTRESFGIPDGTLERLRPVVTHWIHGAATIRFDHSLEEARAINLEGTRRALAIASGCAAHGRLQRFVYIGTSSVSGRRTGLILEEELEAGQEFFNTYECSKCESERLVRNSAGRLPVVIVRPSIVIGDTRTGATTLFNAVYIPLRLLHRGLLRAVPGSPEVLLDLVPVDWVSEATLRIMSGEASVGGAFHLTAGPARATRLGDLIDSAVRYFDAHDPLDLPRSVEYLSPEEFHRRSESLPGKERALASHLGALFPYITLDRMFSTANTDGVLDPAGIRFPPFAGYAGKIFEFALRTDWGKRPAGGAGS